MLTFIKISFIHLQNNKDIIPLRKFSFIKILTFIILTVLCTPYSNFAQQVLFDFDNAPLYASLPINQTASGITARLSATGQGYSIQNAGVLGFTPPGFSGRIIYPNSIFIADLLVKYDQLISEFSIMYACQELGCDDAATMRVTAYKNGVYVGFSTRTATFPGTWPVDTLRCSFPQGFDSVVIHYLYHPPTCQDYGTIFIADNMRVTSIPLGIVKYNNEIPMNFKLEQNYPNPFNPETTIKFQNPDNNFSSLKLYDACGRECKLLVNEDLAAGYYKVTLNAGDLPGGIYFCRLISGSNNSAIKLVLIK